MPEDDGLSSCVEGSTVTPGTTGVGEDGRVWVERVDTEVTA